MKTFVLLCCAFLSAVSGDSSCREQIQAVRNCVKAELPQPPNDKELEENVTKCFTSNGCKAPTAHLCVKRAGIQAYANIEACVQADHPDFDFPEFNDIHGHLLDILHPDRLRQMAVRRFVKNMCGGGGGRKTKSCLRNLFPSPKQRRELREKTATARRDCETKHPITAECKAGESAGAESACYECGDAEVRGFTAGVRACFPDDPSLAGMSVVYGKRAYTEHFCDCDYYDDHPAQPKAPPPPVK